MSAHILVIDDEPVVRGLVVEILESAGYTVATADRADDALELLETEEHDLVLSDIVMPGLSGVDLLRRVRVRRPNLPVVLVTGAGTYDLLGEALLEGADAILLKPFAHAELERIVAAVFTRVDERERDYRVRFLRELEEPGRPEPEERVPASGTRVRHSVLLVEDDRDHAELAAHALERALPGATVIRAPDVATAAKLSRGSSWSLAILDYHLPDGTGLDVVPQLRDTSRDVPILVLTGEGSEAIAVEAFRRGATDYVVKGANYIDELGDRAKRLVGAA